MYKNESGYTQVADDSIRKYGMAIPFIVLVYGLLIQLGYLSSVNYAGPLMFGLITIGWLILGIFQFATPSKTALMSSLRLIADHLLAALSCIFISDYVLILWPILMMATYIYFGKVGVKLNIIGFLIISATTVLLHIDNLNYSISTIVLFLALSVTGITIIVISRTHEINQEKLYQSQVNESLQRDRVAAIVNNLTDAIISTDSKGLIRVYNAASLDLLNTNVSLNGHSIDKFLHLVDLDEKSIDLLTELKKSKTVIARDDVYNLHKNGTKSRLSLIFTPIRRGYSNTRKSELHDGYIIILRDITKEKGLETERDEFISVASHELRTPITIAEGTISNLKEMIKRPDATMVMLKSAIKLAHDQILFLANMVNDLSTLSRAEQNTSDDAGTDTDAEDVDLTDIAQSLINKYSEDASRARLTLDLDISPGLGIIHVNRLYLEELLQNLMTNALKYTKKGTITIIIKREKSKIYFAIKDTGIGISKSDQRKIFDKFFRSEDSRTHESAGTGLGLYVAAKLAHKLGAKIDLTSRLNFGSTFSFTLSKNESDKNL